MTELITRMIEASLAPRTDHAETPADPRPAPFDWVVTYGGQPRLGGIDWTSNHSIHDAAELEYDLRQAGVLPLEDRGDYDGPEA